MGFPKGNGNMIAWDDFDTRTTKVLCDSCGKDISERARAALKRNANTGLKGLVWPGVGVVRPAGQKYFHFRLGNWLFSLAVFKSTYQKSALGSAGKNA